ncbi:hypothetical protein TNCV_2958581 [Trichonephila clavipes]|nr:hypothetical protein TNCV_2958581 [Trichonephila clavipes]
MIKEPVKKPCCHFWGMKWLLCVLTWIRGCPNATVRVVNVTMKREMSFICPQDVKNQVGSCSILEKAHFAKASLCAVSAGKSSWHDWQFVRVQLEGFDEEYCGQMMVK